MADQDTTRSSGFTLIELMIVVAIIGILAAVAIPSFLNYQLTAKRAEAFSNLSSLAKAQKSYYAEYNVYVGVLPEPSDGTGLLPGALKRDSTPIDGAFSLVGWQPDGDVFFDYDTAVPGFGGLSCGCTGCFTATAYGDLDGDGLVSMVLYAQPDAVGGVCPTLLYGFFPPQDASGNGKIGEVARVLLADDF